MNNRDIRYNLLKYPLCDRWLLWPFEKSLEAPINAVKLKKKDFQSEGKYPVIDQGEKFISGYINNPNLLYKGELPVIIFGDHTTNIKYIDFEFAIGADGTKVLSPFSYLNPKFFYYFLKSISIPHQGYSRHYKFLKSLSVPITDINEQKSIADKLDKAFEYIDTVQTRMDTIPELLKRFREMVLRKAVSGGLTEAWRKNKKMIFALEIEGAELNDIGWKVQLATDCCVKVQSGSTPRNSPFTAEGEIPFLKVYNIANQKIAFDYKPQFISKDISSPRSVVYPNDILMNIVGPPLGKIALVTGQYPEWNINQAIVLFRPKKYLLPKFLYYVLCDGREIENISLELKGSAGQQNISLTQSRNFRFDIPTIEEQKEIISKVESLLSIADEIEEKFNTVKKNIDDLPNQILNKAFKGELVEPDPNDEPVEILLERIKEELAKMKPAKRRRK